MSILIKGMEMPKNCDECVMRSVVHRGYIMCELTHQLVKSGVKDRYDNCPLIELPPHGRLGDLDKLYEEISNGNKAYNGIEGYDGEYQHIGDVDDCLDVIKMVDTVIEAEGSETEWISL